MVRCGTIRGQIMKENPYTLAFGYPPVEMIERTAQAEQIIEMFCRKNPTNYINLVTGVRGSGKTVFMTNIASRLNSNKDWIIVNLNARRDLLQQLASKLDSNRLLHGWFQKAEINLQAFGIGLGIKDVSPVSDIEEAVTRMLKSIKEHKKRLLITVDEASNSKDMRIFASAYQIFLREGLPVFLIMTGLYKDIKNLRDASGMTFLERAPRTVLKPLDLEAITKNYTANLSVRESDASRYAVMTRGYSFAFQVIGYFLKEYPKDKDRAITESKKYLYEFAYDKIWSEISPKDRQVVIAAASVPSGEISKIRNKLNYTSNQFNPYRDRLIKAGIMTGDTAGIMRFALPFFDDFAKKQSANE